MPHDAAPNVSVQKLGNPKLNKDSAEANMTATDVNTNEAQIVDEPAASAGSRPLTLMVNDVVGNLGAERHRLTDYPSLATLRLTEDDLAELSQQGFICREERGHRVLFKLRFRRAQRQVVRYIGDAGLAAAIQFELAHLQADRHRQLELERLAKCARRMVRDTKQELEPIVEAANLRFHGLALRRPRQRKTQP